MEVAKREILEIYYDRNRVVGNMLQLSSVTISSMLRCVVLCPTIWAEHHFFSSWIVTVTLQKEHDIKTEDKVEK